MELKLTLSNGNSITKEIDDFSETLDDTIYNMLDELYDKYETSRDLIVNALDSEKADNFTDVYNNSNNDIDELIDNGTIKLEFSDENLIGTETEYFELYDLFDGFNNATDEDVVYAILEIAATINNFESMIDNIGEMYLVKVSNEEMLGRYFVEEFGGVGNIEDADNYFDYEAYGRDVRSDLDDDYYDRFSDYDLGVDFVESIGGIDNIQDAEYYFDYEAYGSDLAYDFDDTSYGYLSRN